VPLSQATGVFSIAIVRPAARHVRLVADKLGIRPIYYAATPRYAVFSTTLRTFDALDIFEKTLDVRGMTEISAFEYPLGDRTHYDGLRRIRPAEIVDILPDGERHSAYWRWDDIEESRASIADAAHRSHTAFVDGLRRRLTGHRPTIAYLSGGLDSRAVVGALVSEGADVETFNFARAGTQDRILGAAIAERLGTRHHEVPKPPGARTPDYAQLMKTGLDGTDLPRGVGGAAVVWSGEGGSVALGHVHMHRPVVERLRAGDDDRAITEFLEREDIRIPLKMFRRSMLPAIRSVAREGVREELARLPHAEPGNRFHLFLLHNDQRRKLTRHFEQIDLNRLEFQLPFFDSDFLATVVSVPLDERLEHRFYSRWFEQFDPVLRSVAWQAYPGHDPCPVPPPAGLSYQWDQSVDYEERTANTRALLTRARRLITSSDFPGPILSRPHVAAAAALHGARLRNYDYALEAAAVCHQYWRDCKGRWVFKGIAQISPG
jgi:asparagine synthetase B (glutamine-hydrolysing)